MSTISFEYTDINYPKLEIKSDHGVVIHLSIDGNEIDLVTIDSDYELQTTDDTLNGLFVLIKFQPYSLAQILQEGERQLDDILEEVERENREEAAMSAELSCPRATGRI